MKIKFKKVIGFPLPEPRSQDKRAFRFFKLRRFYKNMRSFPLDASGKTFENSKVKKCTARFELAPAVWKTENLPLIYAHLNNITIIDKNLRIQTK